MGRQAERDLTRREFLGRAARTAAGAAAAQVALGSAVQNLRAHSAFAAPATSTVRFLSTQGGGILRRWQQEVLLPAFKTSNPEVNVEVETISWDDLSPKLISYAQINQAPDLAMAFPALVYDWAANGMLEPITEWLPKEWGESRLPIVTKGPGPHVLEGKAYFAPWNTQMMGIVTRKDILTSAGVDPYRISNVASLLEALPRIASKVNGGKPITVASGTPQALIEDIGWVFVGNGLGSIADFSSNKKAAYLESLRTLKALWSFSPEDALTWNAESRKRAFLQSQVAFYSTGNWYLTDLLANNPDIATADKIAIIAYPNGSERKRPHLTWTATGLVMLKGGRNKKDAAKLVELATSSPIASKRTPHDMMPFRGYSVDDRVKTSPLGEQVRWWVAQWLNLRNRSEILGEDVFSARNETLAIFHQQAVRLMRGQQSAEDAYENMKRGIEPLQRRK
jgi:ABC-type glycerol-3-phosphate transport system substrate-binding protein